MNRRRWRIPLLLAVLGLGAAAVSALLYSSIDAEVLSIDPHNGYVRVSARDRAGDALAIRLEDLAIRPGDTIRLECLGTFFNGRTESKNLAGVFSTNASLLPPAEPHRVPGAIDVGLSRESGRMFYGDESTDIPEDFEIDDTTILVPEGATHLFVAPPDTLFSDNHDRDGDFAVRITRLPAAWWPRFLLP